MREKDGQHTGQQTYHKYGFEVNYLSLGVIFLQSKPGYDFCQVYDARVYRHHSSCSLTTALGEDFLHDSPLMQCHLQLLNPSGSLIWYLKARKGNLRCLPYPVSYPGDGTTARNARTGRWRCTANPQQSV